MFLDSLQFQEFKDDALSRIELAFNKANANGELEKIAKQFGVLDLIDDVPQSFDLYDRRRCKILVLCIQFHDIDSLKLAAKKKFGIDPKRIVFQEYKSNFNYGVLRYNSEYSDIICGPIPHSGVGIGRESSFLAAAEKNPEEYPKVQKLLDNRGELKFTKMSFIKCLSQSNFVRGNCLHYCKSLPY